MPGARPYSRPYSTTSASQELKSLSSKRIAIAGLGAIGRSVARKLADRLPGLALSGIATRDRAKAQAWLDREAISCPLISLEDLPGNADLALECAPAEILDQICRPMLNAGKQVMIFERQRALAPARSRRPRPGTRRTGHRADRRPDRLRRGLRRRRGHNQHGADGHAQAARGPRRRALPDRQRDFHGWIKFRALRVQGRRAMPPPRFRPMSMW